MIYPSLEINNIKINYSQEELIELGLNIARGTFGKDCIFEWIKQYKSKKHHKNK